jgi:hypothetical protein
VVEPASATTVREGQLPPSLTPLTRWLPNDTGMLRAPFGPQVTVPRTIPSTETVTAPGAHAQSVSDMTSCALGGCDLFEPPQDPGDATSARSRAPSTVQWLTGLAIDPGTLLPSHRPGLPGSGPKSGDWMSRTPSLRASCRSSPARAACMAVCAGWHGQSADVQRGGLLSVARRASARGRLAAPASNQGATAPGKSS